MLEIANFKEKKNSCLDRDTNQGENLNRQQ